MNTHQVRILSTSINVPVNVAYEFAHKPENFPAWAAGLSSSLRKSPKGWVADTPGGEAEIRFTEHNDYGVLDHWVAKSSRCGAPCSATSSNIERPQRMWRSFPLRQIVL